MTEFTRELLFGKRPLRRTNPKPGQSEYYYVDPRSANRFADMKQIDVPSADTPNPYAIEIQQYLHDNDEFNYKQLYGDTPPTAQTQNSSAPNCYMTFNGQNLNLYNNTDQVGSLDAQSGHDDFQSAQYQNVANKGPIPEGTYYANQDQRQNITALDAVAGTGIGIANKLGANIHRGTWNGGPISWGTKRVWLQPDDNTNTYGRSGFTIHGGLSKGSAGCIDIPWQTGKLSNYLDDCQDSVPVYVKYPKNW